jgi:hypothetical protein
VLTQKGTKATSKKEKIIQEAIKKRLTEDLKNREIQAKQLIEHTNKQISVGM